MRHNCLIYMVLSLAAVFSHDAWSRDTEPAGTEPVQAHVRPMESRAMFTGGMFARLDSQNRAGGDVDFVAGKLLFGTRSGYRLAIGYSTEIGLRRDILYANGYWAGGDFPRPASSGPSPPGPAGTPFSDPGAGGRRQSLWPRRFDSAGVTVGLQTFFADEAANWAVELGHRQHLDTGHVGLRDTGETALTTRAQYRFTDRFLLQLDAYYAIDAPDPKNRRHPDAENGKDSSALRVELRVSF